MKRWMNAFAAILFLVTAGWANGQVIIRPDPKPAPVPEPIPAPEAAPKPTPVTGPVVYDGAESVSGPVGGRLRQCFNKHGLCCDSDLTWFGCGNFHTEMAFIFGSCRTFWRQNCAPKPPHRLREGGFGLGNGFGLGSRFGFGQGAASDTSCPNCR